MRIAIITPELPHHKAFCAHLARNHDVAGVVHPMARDRGLGARLRRARQRRTGSSPTYTVLNGLASVRSPLLGWDWISAYREAEHTFFPTAAVEYEASVAAVARPAQDINAPETIEAIRALNVQAVVCLGGPVYREALIEACAPMINWHSGVSPLYNGANTILFAYSNGHVHLCGGTLMTMSPVVDGGDILAHYLPEIEDGDTPATLFMKTVGAAPRVCSEFLYHLERHGRFTRSPQSPPLFTCRGSDWTIYQTQRIRQQLDADAAATRRREAQTIEYWALPSDAHATTAVSRTITRLLGMP